MKKINYKGRCEKRQVSKCSDICRTYSKLQSAFVDLLEKDDSVVSFECNVPLKGVAYDMYSTDIVVKKTDGSTMVRECVWRVNLQKPSYAKVSVRLTDQEADQLITAASACGLDTSAYVRARTLQSVDRIFYDPSMMTELRAYRETIREMVQHIAAVRQRVDRDNYVQMDELSQIHALVRSIYNQMDKLQQSVEEYKKELYENGNN